MKSRSMIACAALLTLWGLEAAIAQPRGSYLDSCVDVRQRGPFLSALCRDRTGRLLQSRIDLESCGNGDITNNDGQLSCSGRRSGGGERERFDDRRGRGNGERFEERRGRGYGDGEDRPGRGYGRREYRDDFEGRPGRGYGRRDDDDEDDDAPPRRRERFERY